MRGDTLKACGCTQVRTGKSRARWRARGGQGWGRARLLAGTRFLWGGRSLFENSQVVEWLGLCVSTAEGPGSIPGQGAKIPEAVQCGQEKSS